LAREGEKGEPASSVHTLTNPPMIKAEPSITGIVLVHFIWFFQFFSCVPVGEEGIEKKSGGIF